MTKPVGVVFVHGIGRQDQGWADAAARRLTRLLRERLAALLPAGTPPPEPGALLIVDGVSWDHLLRPRQQLLGRLLAQPPVPPAEPQGRWGWLRRLFDRSLRRAQAVVVTEFIGDIIGYLHAATRQGVQEEMSSTLERMARRLPAGAARAPLTIVAHSLGTVIASEYVYDHAKTRRRAGDTGFHPRWELANFFTLGSPLALFSLKFGGADEFKAPITMEARRGRWINVYDPDDPIGMPLKRLNEAYRAAVHRDVTVQAGAYLLAHLRYLDHAGVLSLIAEKLALDWLALNHAPDDRTLEALYATYDGAAAGTPTADPTG
jgi:hypothetical protein